MTGTLKIKLLHPSARAPERGSAHAIGYDCFACLPPPGFIPTNGVLMGPGVRKIIPLGFSMQLDLPVEGMSGFAFYGRISPRSGLSIKEGVMVMAGVVDSDYRGEVSAVLYNASRECIRILPGQKVCQLILEAAYIFPVEQVDELDDTVRGSAGFGSTGG